LQPAEIERQAQAAQAFGHVAIKKGAHRDDDGEEQHLDDDAPNRRRVVPADAPPRPRPDPGPAGPRLGRPAVARGLLAIVAHAVSPWWRAAPAKGAALSSLAYASRKPSGSAVLTERTGVDETAVGPLGVQDRKSTRLNSSH